MYKFDIQIPKNIKMKDETFLFIYLFQKGPKNVSVIFEIEWSDKREWVLYLVLSIFIYPDSAQLASLQKKNVIFESLFHGVVYLFIFSPWSSETFPELKAENICILLTLNCYGDTTHNNGVARELLSYGLTAFIGSLRWN